MIALKISVVNKSCLREERREEFGTVARDIETAYTRELSDLYLAHQHDAAEIRL